MAFGYGPAKCPHAGTAYRNRIRSKQMMAHADTRLAELAERLMSLDQERAAIVAEIEALRSAHAFEMSPHTGASTELHAKVLSCPGSARIRGWKLDSAPGAISVPYCDRLPRAS